MNNNLLVFYIGVKSLNPEDVEEYIYKVKERVMPVTFEGEIIFIPVSSSDSRIECLNPVYITDAELIKEHTEKMKELYEHLQNQIDQLKAKNI